MRPLPLPGADWPRLRWLLLLLAVAAGLRAWQITHTEVATRDSIAYTRYAWRLGEEPFAAVARTSEYHPGYPALVYLASLPARAALPDDLPRAMQLSAQLVSCLAGVLLVVPMFLFGCELFDRRVSFWATLLFQVLPSSGRLMPDGLTEPVFLLFATASLFASARGLRTGKAAWFAAAGVASGLAYLTRTEGLLLAAAAGLALLLTQTRAATRRPWPLAARDAGVLSAATLALAVPFMAVIGGVSAKPSATQMVRPAADVAMTSTALPVASWNFGPDVKPSDRYGWAAWALASMIDKSFFHVLTLPFLAGLALRFRRDAADPAAWVPLLLCALLVPLLYRLGQSNGYLGERHVMLIVACGVFWAVDAVAACGTMLAARWPRAAVLTPVVLAALALAPLPKTLARLHGERAGFRQAGEWLARHAGPDELVVDPFSWSSYYAGRTFYPGHAPQPVPADWAHQGRHFTCYVVLDRSKSRHEHLRHLLDAAERLAAMGEEVWRSPEGGRGAVVVYRVEH